MALQARSMRKKFFQMITFSIASSMALSVFNVVPTPRATAAKAAGTSQLISYEGATYASSMEGGLSPDKAVDGDKDSRWGSAFSADPQWIYVDLGAAATIDQVVLRWENAYSKSYKIQVSNDESEWKDIYENKNGDGGVDTIALTGAGRYVRMLSLERAGNYGVSLYEFEVYGTGGSNPRPIVLGEDVALNKPVVASSYQVAEKDKPLMIPQNAVDGDLKTRWSSRDTSDEWLYVDLESVHTIGRIRLQWENAAGRIYDLQVSDDAVNWKTIYREMNGREGLMDTPVYASGRYVRMKGISRTTSFGYSLFNFSVYDYVQGDPQPTYTIPTLPTASTVNVGKGSYLTNDVSMPQPRPPVNKTDNVAAPIASNDWWQSVLIKDLSDSLITLPLKSKYTNQGLSILNPGTGWVDESGNSQYAGGDPDVYLMSGNISASRIKNKISGYSDWAATVVLSDNETEKMKTTFVKGSPYLYSEFSDPTTPELYFPATTKFFDDNNNAILATEGATVKADHIGFTVTNLDGAPKPQTVTRHYGVFAPEGSTFTKVGGKIKVRLGNGQNYLSLATIPTAGDLNYFYQHAYAFVTNTTVTPNFNENTSDVTTKFEVTIDQKRADLAPTTLMTLLPHQWKQTDSTLTNLAYASIRGTLKLHEGNSFTTVDKFNGIVPQFTEPSDPTYSRTALLEQLDFLDESTSKNIMAGDAYWQGKVLHPLAMGVLIADQIGDTYYKNVFLSRLKTILTDWYTYTKGEPEYFMYYDPTWGTMYYKSSEFGANTGLTDHHFTYGYYAFASAILATYDQDFKDNYGGMVEHLIRDYGNPSKNDPLYPFLRNFDPYEGHSWAGGYGDNNSGNNQEAAGEALFGWVGEYMWSLLSGNKDSRDIAIYGFTTELKAVEQYWFNYDNDNWLPGFKHKSVGQVYGSAYNFGTFFSGDPVNVYGIHWLPTGEYLTSYGFDTQKAADLYNGFVKDNKGPETAWQHIVWPIQSLSDSQSVLNKWTVEGTQKNEIFDTYWFVHNMATLGQRSNEIWATGWSGATVYKKGTTYSSMIWNPTNAPVTVTFHNAAGVTGSAIVGPKSLVKVDPTKVSDMNHKIAPQLTPDSSQNTTGQAIELTYADNEAWRNAIKAVKVNGNNVDASKYHVAAGKITLDSSLFVEENSYTITILADGYPDAAIQQNVITSSTVNLALNKPTLTEKANKDGAFAVDGKLDTRWESDFSDPQFLTVNLKSAYKISRVRLNWENAAGKNYTVQVSKDGVEWTTVYTTTRGHEGIDDITFPAVDARYVKVNGTKRTTQYGYSLWEIEVFGTPSGVLDTPELTADTTMNRVGQPIDITFNQDVAWSSAINAVKVNGTVLNMGQYRVAADKITLDASLFPAVGSYEIAIEAKGYSPAVVQQVIITSSTVNLALNKPTITSADSGQAGSKAVDGNKDTRWESAFSDPQFITVDLGSEHTISRALLNWENAAGKSYTVEVSTDGANWKTVYTTTSGKPGINDISFSPVSARYVKMNGTARTTAYGYSLYEFEVYGNPSNALAAPAMNADTTSNKIGQPIEITFADDAVWRNAINAVKLNGAIVSAAQYSIASGKLTLDASLFAEAKSYSISVQASGYNDAIVQQEVTTNTNLALNLALNKRTITSANPLQGGNKAVDGNKGSRWESAFSDPQFITVDLGVEHVINTVRLNWENAAAKSYTLEVSLDGVTWKTVYATASGKAGIDNLTFAPESARYVKMNGTTRTTNYGYSLFEFEVYGSAETAPVVPVVTPVITADVTKNTTGQPIEITYEDDAAWREAIQTVKVNGAALNTAKYTITPGKITLDASLFTEAGNYVISIPATGFGEASVQQVITPNLAVNLALNKPTFTSENPLQGGNKAVDGNKGSRWESAFSDPQWISVDLGATVSISNVILYWENASGKAYTIEVSTDGENWTPVFATTTGAGGLNNIDFSPTNARYVKMSGTQRNTQYGYSLFEMEVYQ
ncbi:discoidin domain-containing protein [Paenibacillus qinlingensis]|uniref:glucan endo-1,3-beta-D-glucosidase n=1 Tax=Paenibacillus qinlingensis TaxID=1837343 RepID=A0ABU1P569_9BACL|nr:discoidin domain-containing protein [Paenibacillus qinlingensis]MDR6554843.1 endoglucanase Acf2 [Paenibacillus qinlingensis]